MATTPDSSPKRAKPKIRGIKFSPVAVLDTGEVVKTQFANSWAYSKKIYVQIVRDLTRWEWATLALLGVSTTLFFVAFLTNGWGTLTVMVQGDPLSSDQELPQAAPTNLSTTPAGPAGSAPDPSLRLSDRGYEAAHGEFWRFGLWQCCRHDGFCLGPRFAQFYAATRSFAVLGLFGHVVTLAWFLGHSVEKIVRCDLCAYRCLMAFSWTTAACCYVSVCCFGIRWPIDFAHEYHGTNPHLSYSFYLAALCIPLMVAAGVTILIHMRKLYVRMQAMQPENMLTAEELLGTDDDGNIKYA